MRPTLILASQSPRRKELLAILGIPFDVIPADIAEVPGNDETPHAFAVRVSREKGLEVSTRVSGSVILSADTVVTIDGLILGKPTDETHAVRMLQQLSGRQHSVYTAVCVIDQTRGAMHEALEKTDVWFDPMTEVEIRDYVQREDVLDKAGAYAIQGFASVYISKISGNYGNVMGLPLPVVHDFLSRTAFYF